MDYFSKFLRTTGQVTPKEPLDHASEFHRSWNLVRSTLMHPDERQLSKGIRSTGVPAHLQSMMDFLVWESTRSEEGETGVCLEYLLKHDVLGELVRLSEDDRPSGIQAEVLRMVQNMLVLLNEQFLVHSSVHRAISKLLRTCVGDDIQEQLDGRKRKMMGAAGTAVRTPPSEHEENLVHLLCILCSRIRTHRELLMIFFHDKHWYRSDITFDADVDDDESDEEEGEDEDEDEDGFKVSIQLIENSPSSPSPSQETMTSTAGLSRTRKPEYEFLLFNYLLRFVHREGLIGDFARAGLLFLMDVAMSPGEPINRLGDDLAGKEAPSDPITDAALALAEYIVDGDFSEVLGAGLGAVYSLLPSKLEFGARPMGASDTAYNTGMVIGGGNRLETDQEREAVQERKRALGVEDASSADFRCRLDHFLKLLEFIQDIVRRNVVHEAGPDSAPPVGLAIVQSILDAVRRIFLENVLYPSILECSDSDGSAVAVVSYIEIIIRTLGDGSLSDLFVNFLMSEDNDALPRSRHRTYSTVVLGGLSAPSSAMLAPSTDKHKMLRRQKSSAMMLLEMEAPKSNKPSEYFTTMGRFTLKDLLLSNLRSTSQPTATAALQLLQSMLLNHPQLTADRLLIVIPDPNATSFPRPVLRRPPHGAHSLLTPEDNEDDDDTDSDQFFYPGAGVEPSDESPDPDASVFVQPQTTYFTHEREMGLYLALVSRVDPSHNADVFSTGYDHYVRDALLTIQSQRSFQPDDDAEVRSKRRHRLNVNDPILAIVLDSLRRFFSNSAEFNIALTGLLATLAINPDRSLAGWLTFGSNDEARNQSADSGAFAPADDDGDDRSIDFQIEASFAQGSSPLPASSMDEQSQPVIHSIFHGLVAQLENYRQAVDKFDKYLLERRSGLLFNENLTDALKVDLEFSEDTSSARGGSPASGITPERTSTPPIKKPTPASFFTNLLSPKKSRSASPASGTPVRSQVQAPTPSKESSHNLAANPFGPHYQRTSSIVVEPFVAPVPSSGPWAPMENANWSAEEDVFSSAKQWGNGDGDGRNIKREKEPGRGRPTTVTLSRLLDNVVILEESIKELVAIIQARRTLGIDPVRYL